MAPSTPAAAPITVTIATSAKRPSATLSVDYEVVRPGHPRWEDLYGIWRDYWPEAREYEKKTDRKFPVVRLLVPPSA